MNNEPGELFPVRQPSDPTPVPWEPETPNKDEPKDPPKTDDEDTIKLPEVPGITPSA